MMASAVYGRRRVRFFSGIPTHALFAELTRLVEDGTTKPFVHAVHPLSRIAEAHRALEAGGVRGKLVVEIG
ncbi:zinc-binding dehydrogenase [Nonomuraea longispora]|nr:zinc-binding dehydrogenase [Nonomuraea longispora]